MNELKSQALHLPDTPGVYLMKNKQGKIVYIGKARSLKKRVKSYFTSCKDVKIQHLQTQIANFETFVTKNEGEALLLENNLIKRWKPRYNINLKDGKTYPVIKLTNEAYPRVYRTRRIIFDGSKYYGPFPRANQIDLNLNLIDKLFPLRKCKGKLRVKNHPCLNHHINRCSAPCCSNISQKEYIHQADKVRMLLSGKTDVLIRELKEKMNEAAGSFEYEKAGIYRNQISAIKSLTEEQKVVDFQDEARDYIGIYTEDALSFLTILQMRGGKLIGRDFFLVEDHSPEEDILTSFLAQYYSSKNNLPLLIYLPYRPYGKIDAGLITDFLKKLTGKAIRINFPQKGKHAQILKMAVEASRNKLESREQKQKNSLIALQEALSLNILPRRIEGFDIAHLSGHQTVAAMVSFWDGQAHKSDYRHYHIKSLGNRIDDFEAIREVVARRYTRLLNEKKQKPDLILIDGGKGQVSSAVTILRALGLSHIPLVGLAKKNEEIFLPDRQEPVILPESSAALKILQAVRDEAHRFANTFHKKLKSREVTTSVLEQIKGIGKKRSKLLLERFGSIQEIRSKKPQEISKAAGLSLKQASKVIDYLKAV